MNAQSGVTPFAPYQKFVVAVLALLQFAIVLDFMVVSPLGDMLIKALKLKPSEFGLIVSSYAISAGVSGLFTAGFADKFDRKKLLMFFYSGFLIGTLFCALATTYTQLLAARIITGLFGGVVGSVSMAIVTDLFTVDQRGRVLSFIQMGFAVSQVMGIPISILLANEWGWNAPFLLIVGFALIMYMILVVRLKPITEHLKIKTEKTAVKHLLHTIKEKKHHSGFIATALLSLGGFMLMPFASVFAVNNLGVTQQQLPLVFMFTGFSSIIIMPIIGRISDRFNKLTIFIIGSLWAIIMVMIYTNMSLIPLWLVIALNILLFMGIMSRMVPATALVSAIPAPQDRGAFMSINSSLQQASGGIASMVAGLIVVQQTESSPLQHFNILGLIIAILMVLCIYFIYRVDKIVKQKKS